MNLNLLNKLPKPVRQTLYTVAVVGSVAWGAYEAANEDWRSAIPIFFGSLVSGTALTHAK